MPGLAAAAITGGSSCTKEEEDDDEEDSWAVKPRDTKPRGHGWGVPSGGGWPWLCIGDPPPQGGTSLILPVSPSPRGSSLPPSSGPMNMEGRQHGILWRLRASCSLLPPLSALLLTEKQTAKYSKGLGARGGQGWEESSRTAGLSCQALPPVYENTRGQEVLAPQPNTAWGSCPGLCCHLCWNGMGGVSERVPLPQTHCSPVSAR